jgi:ADP-ribose pyrophosphatase
MTKAGAGGPDTTGEDRVLCEGDHLALKKRGTWEYVERRGANSGAMVVAITDDRHLVLVEEDRPPVGGRVVSLPAGLVGDEGEEDAESAAARELSEETGYDCGPLVFLGQGPTSPGLSSETVLFFLGRGARRRAGARPEEGITVHEVPLREAFEWARERERSGARIHPLVWAGLYLAERAGV